MAGGTKKKRKVVANPARGFATTSIISKARVQDDQSNSAEDNNLTTPETFTPTPTVEEESHSSKDRAIDLKDLTPEELELELEKGELQQIVDKYATKVHRDVARQVAQLETDRRISRTHADNLSTRIWFDDETNSTLLDLIKRNASTDINYNTSPTNSVNEEILLVRIWTLRLILDALGILARLVEHAIQHVLDLATIAENSDVQWGVTEALECIALCYNDDEIQEYDHQASAPVNFDVSEIDDQGIFITSYIYVSSDMLYSNKRAL